MRHTRLSRGPFLAALASVLAATPPIAAQIADSTASRPSGASPLLPDGHWSIRAAARAEAMGLAPGYLPAQGLATQSEVEAALRQALARSAGMPVGPLVRGWLDRFLQEYPGADTSAAGPRWLGGAVGSAYREASGGVAPAIGFRANRIDPAPLPPSAGLRGVASGGARLGDVLAGAVTLEGDDASVQAAQWEAVLALGGAALSVGRAPIRYGWAADDGLVLGGQAILPRAELRTARPQGLPGVLRPLGRVTAHTFLARLDESRHPTDPWLWGARVAVRPHDRVTLGINRASIFGGDSAKVTFGKVVGMVAGVLSRDFENQVVSVDARYRLPTESFLPLTVYGEWGSEDAAGAWVEQPALLFGVQAAALPALPELSLGVEAAHFATCCGHGNWYQHVQFAGHWAARDRPLGHRLGGAGDEVAFLAAADLLGARLRMDGRAFVRDRSGVHLEATPGPANLFAPLRSGRSTGGRISAEARLHPRLELSAAAAREDGGDWAEDSFELEVRYLF